MTTFLVLWAVMLTGAIVLILLGAGQLMARVVRLEDEVDDLRTQIDAADTPSAPQAAIGWADGSPTLVLAVEPRCIACKERTEDLADLVDSLPSDKIEGRRFVVLGPSGIDDHAAGSRIETMSDNRRFGQLVITATPTVIVFDDKGRERSRSVVGNKQTLERAVDEFVATGPSPSNQTEAAMSAASAHQQGDRS